MSDDKRTALVTGGNRGIGLETCRQLAVAGLSVVLTARDSEKGAEAARGLRGTGLDVQFAQLDVSCGSSVAVCRERLRAAGTRIDVLVNNAGVYSEGDLFSLATEELNRVLDVNFLGPLRVCQAFVPPMVEAGYGRVVNVSSSYGALNEGLSGPAAYSLSKAALNGLTVRLAAEVRGDVKINAACPGWVRTRMGGPGADRGVLEAVDSIVWLATLPETGPSGGFFRDRQPIPW